MAEGKTLPVLLEEEIKTSYLNYAMSVIVGRALPDVRDGLKPVQRRILYSMHELGLLPGRPYKKAARLVGDVLGKYHPHGDMAVYDAVVRMAQDFSLRHPLVDGQGNFGSVDGDPPAAMRYTEVRLTPLATELLEDLDKETVDFLPNFDGSLKEPSVLPAKFPNLLLNGSSGIAVGMATNIPPHNLGELVDACLLLIDNPGARLEDVLKVMPGPDFPTGGIILGKRALKKAYREGRGKITLRGRIRVEESERGERIIIEELPYQVNKANLVEKIATLSQENRIRGIRTLRDESDRKGIRVVIELTRRTSPEVVINQLYKHTPLQVTFGIILLALVNGKPVELSLPEVIRHYLEHRKEVVLRRTRYLLQKTEKEAHLLEGLVIALERLEEVIEIIKKASSPQEAEKRLIKFLGLTPPQAEGILNMRLSRLTRMEREKIEKDLLSAREKIKNYREILDKEEKVWKIIKEELKAVKEKYSEKRRTEILPQRGEITFRPEDLIKKEEVVITLTREGYIKLTPLRIYRSQRRGGKGVRGMGLEEGDTIKDIFSCDTHSTLLFFTSRGRVYWAKAYELPQGGRDSRGRALVNFLSLQEEERVSTVIPLPELEEKKNLLMVTSRGMVKKTPLSFYSRSRKGGVIGIALKEKDRLVKVLPLQKKEEILLITRKGKVIRFREGDVRTTGRASQGVKGISLSPADEVKDAIVVREEESLLIFTSQGYGKKTSLKEFKPIHRGGKGVVGIKLTPKKGEVVGVKRVKEEEEVLVITRKGKSVRLKVREVSERGRYATGSRIIRLEEGDELISLT